MYLHTRDGGEISLPSLTQGATARSRVFEPTSGVPSTVFVNNDDRNASKLLHLEGKHGWRLFELKWKQFVGLIGQFTVYRTKTARAVSRV
jgi:hypothetical protein